MRAILTVVTRKGQVTIPAEIRRAMGLKKGDKVAFTAGKDGVRLVRAGSVVDMTEGILKSNEPPLTAEELREAAADAWVADAIERGRA